MADKRASDRRPTRLSCYDYSQNGLYFLTICTKHRQKILCDIIVGDGVLDVPETKLTQTGKIVEKYIHSINNVDKLSVEKYVIMPDHIHLILYIDDIDPIGTSRTPSPINSRIPKTISGFKRLCNKEIGKNIWQRSFHDHIIRDEKDYAARWDYIENNPALWLLGKDEI